MSGPSSGRVTIRFPRVLLQYWTGPAKVDVDGKTLAEAFAHVNDQAPGLAARILDDQGQIRRHVAIFVNGTMLTGKDPSAVSLQGGDEVHVVPSVSGG
ncbi:MAG TPA: MoaD/ThiS family protein [Candidatus Thermoplasmatota archaeon]